MTKDEEKIEAYSKWIKEGKKFHEFEFMGEKGEIGIIDSTLIKNETNPG